MLQLGPRCPAGDARWWGSPLTACGQVRVQVGQETDPGGYDISSCPVPSPEQPGSDQAGGVVQA